MLEDQIGPMFMGMLSFVFGSYGVRAHESPHLI
jgi:hypothetical protein